MSSEDVWKAMDELRKMHQENIVQQAILSTRVGSLVEKIDHFVEHGTPRCSTNIEKIASLERFKRTSIGIFTSVFLAMIGTGMWLWRSGVK